MTEEGERGDTVASVVASMAPPGPWICHRIGALGFVPCGLSHRFYLLLLFCSSFFSWNCILRSSQNKPCMYYPLVYYKQCDSFSLREIKDHVKVYNRSERRLSIELGQLGMPAKLLEHFLACYLTCQLLDTKAVYTHQ